MRGNKGLVLRSARRNVVASATQLGDTPQMAMTPHLVMITPVRFKAPSTNCASFTPG